MPCSILTFQKDVIVFHSAGYTFFFVVIFLYGAKQTFSFVPLPTLKRNGTPPNKSKSSPDHVSVSHISVEHIQQLNIVPLKTDQHKAKAVVVYKDIPCCDWILTHKTFGKIFKKHKPCGEWTETGRSLDLLKNNSICTIQHRQYWFRRLVLEASEVNYGSSKLALVSEIVSSRALRFLVQPAAKKFAFTHLASEMIFLYSCP